MTRKDFKELIDKGLVYLDGATGTNLQMAGMPVGVCPEKWILDNRDIFIKLQKDFVEAGTNILLAPTFTANRIKLAEYGLEDNIIQMNKDLIALSKEASGGKALVAGDITMTGQQLYPMGDMHFEDLIDIYKEQVKIIAEAGADLIAVETMMSLNETRAAVIAIKEVCDLPIIVTLTFEEDGRTLYGTPPEVLAVAIPALGADAVGMNCSSGLQNAGQLIDLIYKYSTVAVIAKPNNGLPELIDGKTFYKNSPENFAEGVKELVEHGARIVGGCCGSTPEHIKALVDLTSDIKPLPIKDKRISVITSERELVEIDINGKFQVIGERINPTGKKALQEELRAGKMDLVRKLAREEEKNGADILDVNMGTNGIDEKETMLKAIETVTEVSDLPLAIDSSFVEVIEAALRVYPGRALINSISCESDKINALLPIAKKYGAMFILLPLDDEGIPETIVDKHRVLDSGLEKAYAAGFDKNDIIVDGLVATVGANKNAAIECFETFKYCKDMGIATTCGLSNISFGLPERAFVNTAFLTMAINNGLTMAIANPNQDLLMNAAAASDMLLNKKNSDLQYINRIAIYEENVANSPIVNNTSNKEVKKTNSEEDNPLMQDKLFKAVLEGDKSNIVAFAKEKVDAGEKADLVINTYLIPAINLVGKYFNDKKYFLPQLIASANAMKEAISYLEPLIERDESKGQQATIIMATVEGDVHDIGKNLVCLMLKNYGYNVIDMGKDVPSVDIIDKAIEENAQIVGLSALMTTTMVNMKEVIAIAKEKNYKGKIIIGGAAVTNSYAEEIGADGYSKDAADCVKLVEKLLA